MKRGMGWATNVAGRSWMATAIMFLLLVVFVGLLASGIHFLTDEASDKVREGMVMKYTDAVTEWNRSGREKFAKSANWTVSAEFLNDTRDVGGLRADEAPDTLHDPDAANLPAYSPLKYVGSPQLEIHTEPWRQVNGSLQLSYNAPPGAPSVTYSVPLLKETQYGTPTWKVCEFSHHGGLVQRGGKTRCVVFSHLKHVCLRMKAGADPDSTQHTFNITEKDNGCLPRGLKPYDMRVVTTGRYSEPRKGNLSSFDLMLRSDTDPYLVAWQLTNGTLTFGTTATERVHMGFVLLGSAVGAIAVSVTLFICCLRECGYYSLEEDSPDVRSYAGGEFSEIPPARRLSESTPGQGYPIDDVQWTQTQRKSRAGST